MYLLMHLIPNADAGMVTSFFNWVNGVLAHFWAN